MFTGNIVETTGNYSVVVLTMFLFLSVFVILFKRKNIRNLVSRRFTFFIFFVYAVSLFYFLFNPAKSMSLYFLIILPLLVFYFTSSYSMYVRNDNLIIWMVMIMLLLLSFFFIDTYYNNIMYDATTQNNASYTILYLLPFLLCHKKQFFRIIAILLCLLILMYSLKRGGLIAFMVAVIAYFVVQTKINSSRKSNFIIVTSILIVVSISLYYLFIYFNNRLDGLVLERLLDSIDSEGSGRLDVYRYYLNSINNSSILYFLFGRGWEGSLRVGNMSLTSHNDFIEVFIDFGIIGLVLYLLFIVSLIKLFFKMIKIKHEYAPAMAASLCIFFVNSMVSHIFIYTKYMLLFALFWGFVVSSVSFLKDNK